MIIVFNASNWYIYSRIKFYLTWQLGERLANIASAIAFGLDAEKILKVEEDQRAYKEIKNLLGNVKEDNELADLGTIFLDEIGEISPTIQAKLLRVLEEKRFNRVGGVETIQVDTRVIAATNKDLEQNVKVGKFREDLHFRLNVFPIWIPPLRKRREDITLLVEYFLIKYHYGRRKLLAVLMDQLINYDWPGM